MFVDVVAHVFRQIVLLRHDGAELHQSHVPGGVGFRLLRPTLRFGPPVLRLEPTELGVGELFAQCGQIRVAQVAAWAVQIRLRSGSRGRSRFGRGRMLVLVGVLLGIGFALELPGDTRIRALLDDVRELVRKQSTSAKGGGCILTRGKEYVVADRVGASANV
jgi:hypothetical protein